MAVVVTPPAAFSSRSRVTVMITVTGRPRCRPRIPGLQHDPEYRTEGVVVSLPLPVLHGRSTDSRRRRTVTPGRPGCSCRGEPIRENRVEQSARCGVELTGDLRHQFGILTAQRNTAPPRAITIVTQVSVGIEMSEEAVAGTLDIFGRTSSRTLRQDRLSQCDVGVGDRMRDLSHDFPDYACMVGTDVAIPLRGCGFRQRCLHCSPEVV